MDIYLSIFTGEIYKKKRICRTCFDFYTNAYERS